MKISILGAGNVATNLALAFKKAGHEIVQIYNRSDDAGKELAKAVAAGFTSDIQHLLDAEIYVLAVKDDAIEERALQLKAEGALVAHTSGTKSKNVLKGCSMNYGIFYPLQTMKKNSKLNFKNVPVLIEGSNQQATSQLKELAHSISQNVHEVNEEQRQWIHVAAVFANNFTNHLLAVSENLLTTHKMSFDILRPLVLSFITNLRDHSPSELQTGPAWRGDYSTIEKHLLLLGDDARLQKMYELLSQSILHSANQHQS